MAFPLHLIGLLLLFEYWFNFHINGFHIGFRINLRKINKNKNKSCLKSLTGNWKEFEEQVVSDFNRRPNTRTFLWRNVPQEWLIESG